MCQNLSLEITISNSKNGSLFLYFKGEKIAQEEMYWKKIIFSHKIEDNKVLWIIVFYMKHEHLALCF